MQNNIQQYYAVQEVEQERESVRDDVTVVADTPERPSQIYSVEKEKIKKLDCHEFYPANTLNSDRINNGAVEINESEDDEEQDEGYSQPDGMEEAKEASNLKATVAKSNFVNEIPLNIMMRDKDSSPNKAPKKKAKKASAPKAIKRIFPN